MRLIKRSLIASLFMFLFAFTLSLGVAGQEEAPVRDEESNYLGRTYDAEFDRMFDQFERDTIAGVGDAPVDFATGHDTAAHITDYHLNVPYTYTDRTDADAAIYKVGSPGNADGSFNFLVFEMRGDQDASIDDLMLSFRLDDNHSLISVPFTELLDPDYQPLPQFMADYQTYVIDILGSLADKEYVHHTTGDTVPAGNAFQGIHLHEDPDSTGEGVVQMDMVYLTNDVNPVYTDSPQYYLLDEFQRTDVSAGADHVWWRDSTGFIVGKHLALDGIAAVASYEAHSSANLDGLYDNAVFRIRGNHGGEDLLITPLYDDNGTIVSGTAELLSDLLGPDSETLPAITTGFTGFVVNFAENGWDKEVAGFRIDTIDGETDYVYVDEIFFTNMEFEEEEVDLFYPVIDPSDILVFDNFDRDTLGATPAYDPNNPVALDHGFNFIIAFAGIDYMDVSGGELVMDADLTDSHMQYTASSYSRINEGDYDYVVLKMRGEGGASLDTFRLASIDPDDNRSPVIWGHSEFLSGQNLQTPAFGDDYPYISGDHYYLIIDIEESGLTEQIAGFDLFYSGDGQLFIDQIFYANAMEREADMDARMVFEDFDRDEVAPDPADLPNFWFDTYNAFIDDGQLVLDATGGQHAAYRTAAYPNNVDEPKAYLYLRMKGADADVTLESFRMNTIPSEDTRFANAGQLIGFDGEPIAIDSLTDEYQYFLIDLEASGLDLQAEGYGLFFGDWGEGQLYIDETGFVDAYNPDADLAATLDAIDLFDPVSTIVGIDIDNEVGDIEVAFGVSEEDAIALLPETILIEGDLGDVHTVTLSWTIADYDPLSSTNYIAIGTFELPEGMQQSDPETALEVTATVTVLQDPDLLVLEEVDVDNEVEAIEVAFGTPLEEAIGELTETIVIEDSAGNTYTVTLTWVSAGYDPETPGEYTAVGTFELPDGVEDTGDVSAEVETTITVLEEDPAATGAIVAIIVIAVALIGGVVVYFVAFKK